MFRVYNGLSRDRAAAIMFNINRFEFDECGTFTKAHLKEIDPIFDDIPSDVKWLSTIGKFFCAPVDMVSGEFAIYVDDPSLDRDEDCDPTSTDDIATPTTDQENGFDPVHNPAHYTEGRKYEPRKVIYDWDLNFNLGSAVKYIARAGRKDSSFANEDLKKAIQCIEFELDEIKVRDVNKAVIKDQERKIYELTNRLSSAYLETKCAMNRLYGASMCQHSNPHLESKIAQCCCNASLMSENQKGE